MKAMILAAGRGERLRPLTDTTPKPMVLVAGKPLLQYHVEALTRAGITELVINHAHLGQQIVDYFKDGREFGASIRYCSESPALETGGAIINALPLLGDEPFVVVNGDVFCDYDFGCLPSLEDGQLAHLLLVANPSHNLNGDLACEKGIASTSGPSKQTYSGMGVFSPVLFNDRQVERIRLPDIWKTAMNEHRIAASTLQGYWCDVGTLERLQEVRKRVVDEHLG
ncbi:N-acetylmuramate alpha-1-phosphate uridylyltransferase MurU [Paraferrimonas haliotis]|uniref:Mannose-1-phosphate guanylyltransferase n=1 Tax=Paraferrimonas haliotis TaxID=2013866 RepID=A0AA37TSP6_9GAMM|nr:nucleotidyltransferase family protein [Paraferrimonas haliotis]GLS82389.1 mannose-1-phosphate guanylyltransferase [Paraferrimonas haliotis]